MSILHVEPFENRGDEGLLAETDPVLFSSGWISMPRNCRAGRRLVILYFSKSLALTLIADLVVSFGDNIEMSSTYKSIRIPSLRR